MTNTAQNKKDHRNLIVYQKAKLLSIDAIKFFSRKKYPKTYEFIVIQLLRSISSIGANIIEGYGRHYKKNYRHFLSIARGSSYETEYWLEVVMELKIFDNKILENFLKRNKELIKMITVMMKKMSA